MQVMTVNATRAMSVIFLRFEFIVCLFAAVIPRILSPHNKRREHDRPVRGDKHGCARNVPTKAALGLCHRPDNKKTSRKVTGNWRRSPLSYDSYSPALVAACCFFSHASNCAMAVWLPGLAGPHSCE